ncbi:myelin regulatory factor [Solea senegalensis]|uniref:Myelin regulatory factor n=1 Tax=Solea senegalensis TaxID=28829 RepID=A0AAV6PGR0_SOLSE|nr:myelin regulatory factor-like protein [Solea senegalensis]XP_043872566.1 myelin regulatory factor-like protein [Solea senegalensis]KAG7458344.1 myelin regulatory factor [Solea senegalensis]
MEPGVSRLPLHVLGENEALQQFFSGQDVSGVLESSVAVDTSILEQYLSNDMDPSSFMLPDSPPDSCSEACSPAQIPDLHRESPYWTNRQTTQEVFRPPTQSSCHFKPCDSALAHPDLLTYNQLRSLGLTNTYVKSGTPSIPPAAHERLHQSAQHSPEHLHYLSPEGCSQVYTPPTPPSPPPPPSNNYVAHCAGPSMVPPLNTPTSTCLLGSTPSLHNSSLPSKRRRRSECEESSSSGIDASCSIVDETCGGTVGNGLGSGSLNLGTFQLLTWEQYRLDPWSSLYDHSYQTLSPPAYHVDTDKGFNYSAPDEAFICQKKNHFQVTIHIGVAAEPQYVKTPRGTQEVDHFQIKVFGIKLEAPSHHVTIEQSQPDRSKKPFHPVRVSLPGGKITKVTLGRLHFSETTANNMRKKGKPNPDQRYFQMVVGLYAAVGEDTHLLTALVSERIIVRASNPGQFEMDGDALWQRGATQDSLVCQGRVGINTDSPDEALVVCGNAKVMGTIMQPSDCRVKENIQEVDSEQQLKRITQMRIVEFDYKPEFASTMGMAHTHQTGIIAQEVKELLPSAVKEVGNVTCSDGETINNFLMVDKEQIFMENIGAVQQLSRLTDNLEARINDLEVWNTRLAKLKSLTGSLRSTGKPMKPSSSTTPTPGASTERNGWRQKYCHCVKRKLFLASVLSLLATMAFCIISITALYLVNLTEKVTDISPGNSNGTVAPLQTTTSASTVPSATPLGPWPPDVDFCDLLYCDQVYCCPSTPGGSVDFNVSTTELDQGAKTNPTETKQEKLVVHQLKSARDWTNTTIHSFIIKENQQVIDSKYCLRDECGPGRFIFRVPISQFVPVNMRVTLLMNSTELLVVHLCGFDESAACSALLDMNTVTGSTYPSNTQGEHEWRLHVARLYHSSYYFRSTVAGQADCSTDHHFAGALFTDYIFHFYRRCSDS